MGRLSITVPYCMALSKNQMYMPKDGGGQGAKYKNPAMAAERDRITYMLRGERRGEVWPQVKTYVKIMVYRPDMLSDPANFTDVILDGVKLGINVDDRWYVVTIDWAMDKENDRIVITVWQ